MRSGFDDPDFTELISRRALKKERESPFMSDCFSSLHPDLQRGIAGLGFTSPTPIQSKAIPPALEGRDVLGCAMTGSGKTAAFVLPILERLQAKPRGTTRALVLSPTRELAAQIVDHFNDLAKFTKLRAAAVYGGVGMQPQEQAFRRGVDVIVACPGRLLDHFSRPYAKLAGLEVLVLDEADRMLDMGFLPDIRRVLRHIPHADQTLFFSATMPRPIVELSRDLLKNPVRLDVERPAAPAAGVSQLIFPIRQDLKTSLLIHLLNEKEIGNALVFTRTKHRANRLAANLEKKGISADRIHGNRSQAQRTKALANFKNGKTRILVATDIAARGIDVEALSHVVNFDVPHMPEDYIHRVGRTARASATGEAFTFVSSQERNDLNAIEKAVGKRLPTRKIEGFDATAPKEEALEIPLKDRIAVIRAKKAEDRARSRAKADRKKGANGSPAPASKRRSNNGGGSKRQSASGRSESPERRSDSGSSNNSDVKPWFQRPEGGSEAAPRRSSRRGRQNR